MKLEKFKDKLFKKGREYGFSEMELYQNKSDSFDLRVFQQEVDHYSINEDRGLSFRGYYDGKLAYSYTEKIDDSAVNMLLEDAKQNAEVIDKKEGEIFTGSDKYQDMNLYNDKLNEITSEEKIEIVKSMEEYAFAADDRVQAVNYCLYSDQNFKEQILNSKGLELSFKNNIAYLFLSVVAQEGEEIKSAQKFQVTQNFNDFNPQEIAEDAVEEAVSLFGSSSLKSGSYPVILRRDIAANILSTFSSTLSAEKVQKGLSLFNNKLGEDVASKDFNLIDDPFLEEGFNSSPFDGEGVATKRKEVIKNGKLTTFLHNLKTAKKAGVESTGNAYRSSHKSSVDIAPTNMYIKPGKISYEDMIKTIKEGIIIIEVQGLHSGANPVSGDFSLGASGYFIQDGKINRPVEQITISGNFLNMLKNVELIADDLKMDIPGRGHFGSPSIKIKSLDIAGE